MVIQFWIEPIVGFPQRETDGVVTHSRDGKTYTFPRGGVIIHVATHGMHHRAQCLNMLRHLGVTSLPPSSVLDWMIQVEGATK